MKLELKQKYIFLQKRLNHILTFGSMHCGLTGGWVQNLKALYLPYFLQCAMVGSAKRCDGHSIPGPDPPLHTGEDMAGMKA